MLNEVSLTQYTSNKPLSKRYWLEDGTIHKQAAAQMYSGKANRVTCSFKEFAEALPEQSEKQAFGYGVHGLIPDVAIICTKGKDDPRTNMISRTKDNFQFRGAGIGMIDHDPSEYGRSHTPETLLAALVAIHPEIAQAARIVRPSISAGVYRAGETPRTDKGFHIYITVVDTTQMPEYGKRLVDHLWRTGHGFIALSANGSMLERTCIDGSVFSAERLDFVGRPIISGAGLEFTAPETTYTDGGMLDISTLPALTAEEAAQVATLKAKAKQAIKPSSVKKTGDWKEIKISAMIAAGATREKATEVINQTLSGGCQDLYADFILEFTTGSVSVGEVLAHPTSYDKTALADPIEGVCYGRTTAKFYWNNGQPVIHSHAHGQGYIYKLRNDPQALQVQGVFEMPVLMGTDSRDGTGTTRPLSELGNAQRLEDAHGGNIHYVHDAKAWLHWRGGAWVWDIDGAVMRGLAAHLPKQIYTEGLLHLFDADYFAKWSRTSQKERTVLATVSLLKDFDLVRLSLSSVDADLFKVGFDNAKQVLDLRTGKARPALQSDLITKSLSVDRLGDSSKAVRWDLFLTQIFGDDAELIDWVKRWCGYMLTGSTAEQIFIFCFGLGANGKSVFGDILRFILCDYARAIASETLTETKRAAGSATPDLADLIGARMAACAETEDGAALAESLVKSLVSGDTMTARKLHCDPFQFTPQFKLMMLGNHKPIIKGNDHGIWRRVRLIPFRRTFKPEERDAGLSDKLKAEAPHILAWMVEGCIDWQERGLKDTPQTIADATGNYQEEQDLIGNWLSECCDLHPIHETSSTDIYSNYQNWCVSNGLRPNSNVALGRRLGERGYACRQSSGKRLWSGIAVKPQTFSARY